jgi:hypothetical protein
MGLQMKLLRTFGVVALLASSVSAANAIVLDGNIDAAYGAPTAVIPTDPAAPNGNFGAPTLTANAGYSIYLDNTGGTLYGLVAASGQGIVGNFTNVYFGQPSPVGSTIGFEVTNQDAFTPGVSGSNISVPIQYVINGNNIEFAIPDSYFTTALTGPLTSDPTQTGSVNAGFSDGQIIQLRLSQSFSFSVAGDPTNPNDLGSFTLEAAVPEPSTWAMMVLGFCGLGFMAYRRKKTGYALSAA